MASFVQFRHSVHVLCSTVHEECSLQNVFVHGVRACAQSLHCIVVSLLLLLSLFPAFLPALRALSEPMYMHRHSAVCRLHHWCFMLRKHDWWKLQRLKFFSVKKPCIKTLRIHSSNLRTVLQEFLRLQKSSTKSRLARCFMCFVCFFCFAVWNSTFPYFCLETLFS